MKNILIATTFASVLATASVAADFDNNGVSVILERDNVTFGLDTVDGEATALSFGTTIMPHTVLGADADLTLGAEYGVISEELTFSAAYELSKRYGQVNTYVDLEAAYTVDSGDTDGVWEATPTVGASLAVNDKLAAFGEVSYTWDASNDWAQAGGSAEIGARYAVTDAVALTPSLVRSFDTGADETNLNLSVALRF